MLINSDTQGGTAFWHRQAKQELQYLMENPDSSGQIVYWDILILICLNDLCGLTIADYKDFTVFNALLTPA